jgi:hypothetical protein
LLVLSRWEMVATERVLFRLPRRPFSPPVDSRRHANLVPIRTVSTTRRGIYCNYFIMKREKRRGFNFNATSPKSVYICTF